MLCDVPRLQYVIVVDKKPSSWQNIPRGIAVHSMDAVKEMGSRPENCERLCDRIKKLSNFARGTASTLMRKWIDA